MRASERNKQTVYYSLFKARTPITDEYGNETGEYTIEYESPVETHMNISAARGQSDLDQFGINNPYSRTMVTCDMECPIATDSILWIGIAPDSDGETGEVKHNYVVVTVAKSLNSIQYAIKEVDVS